MKAALGVAALSISRSKGTYLASKYRRIAARRGPIKAVVAIEHTILTAVWHMLRNGAVYIDLGADYYTRLDPQNAKNKAIRQLQNLGYEVVIARVAA
ncbi:Transposase [Frigoribacterium sp. JB110]|nr:Transposase [Frigoribacterium sp. JB110]